jgi:DNA-binding NtrC family response regulator
MVVAKAIHQNVRRARPALRGGELHRLPARHPGAELFGHVRGSFTGAVADRTAASSGRGGTLFLDEIGEIPLDLQAKLLRVLQERTFERVGDNRVLPLRARIIAANPPRISTRWWPWGTFRKDLLYRLRVVEVRLPPLRERPTTSPCWWRRCSPHLPRVHKTIRYVAPRRPAGPARVRLARQRARAGERPHPRGGAGQDRRAGGGPPAHPHRRAGRGARAGGGPGPRASCPSLAEVERRHIERSCAPPGVNKRRTCAVLQISRPTLDRKIASTRWRPSRPDDVAGAASTSTPPSPC